MKIGVRHTGWYSSMINDDRLYLEPLSGEDVILRQYKKLMIDRLDAFYSPDSISIQYIGKKYHFSEKTKMLFIPEETTALYTVFSKESGEKYVVAYEQALIKLQKNENISKVYK
ncbi:hypothetical protein P4S72_22230 [Vibrio sp. PP-XX7]